MNLYVEIMLEETYMQKDGAVETCC